ncbi:MAG: SusC/RagA family TonB-linked outer membrane protein [Bacteroidales bacterium]|nr:SusC/RagA family TonB-linked outer membrane protein [Bacteroidales bacterium]
MKRYLSTVLLLTVAAAVYAQQPAQPTPPPQPDYSVVPDSLLFDKPAEQLDEIVVIGYGSMHKSDLTGSVASVRVDEGQADRSTSIDQLIQGRAAGVQAIHNGGSPDGGVTIRIRGTASFNGSSEPLYVVDGVLLNTSGGSETLLSRGADNGGSDEATNGLLGLNPSDIKSIEILKDASATAIYGAQGANGVVLITTKTGSGKRPNIRFASGVDISTPYKHIDVLSFDEYVEYLEYMGANSFLRQIYEDPATHTGLKVKPVDWQDEVLRTAVSQRYIFSISGKPKSLAYAFSLTYNNKQGIIEHTGVQQYIVRLNLDKRLSPGLKIGTKFNAAHVLSDMTQSTGGGRMTSATSLVRSMLSYRPYFSATEEDHNLEDDDEELKSSPYRWLDKNHFRSDRKDYRITPNIYALADINSWLQFKSSLGADYRNSERRKFKSSGINTTSIGSNGAIGTYEYFNWNWDNLLMLNRKWRGRTLSGTLGSTAYSGSTTAQTIEGWNIDQFKGGIESVNTAPNRRLSYTEVKNTTLSFFARGVYNYKNRYVLTATYRMDGSSKFRGSNKWASFPSFAFAWRIAEEPWFHSSFVSSAKLRAGWGRVGNQSIAEYQTANTYVTSTISAHNPGNPSETSVTVTPSNFSNPKLKWETSEQYNAGLDLGLWHGRFTVTADAYIKNTFDLLQTKEVPASSGVTSYYVNEGTIQNRGLEFTLDAVPLKTAHFEWSVGGNISFNRNKIIRISETADRKSVWITTEKSREVVCFEGTQVGNSAYSAQTANIFMEGYPMGLFYGYKIKRIVPEGEVGTPVSNGGTPRGPGSLDFYDLNGNGYIDEGDRTIIGNPNPDFIFGFNTSLRYRGLTLSLAFSGSWGNDIFNFNSAMETASSITKHNIVRGAFYDAWRPDNQDAKYPDPKMMENSDFKKFTSLYIEDGSYLRLSNASLSWAVPLKKRNIIRGLTLSASVNNAWVLTKYSGWDPEVNTYGTNVRKMGIDGGSYPSSRTWSFDVKFSF